MVKIPIKNLKFLSSIMGLNLSYVSEVGTKLTSKKLAGTPFEGDEAFMGSTNTWILIFDGVTLPQEQVCTTEYANLLEKLGVFYHMWNGWNMQIQALLNGSELALVDNITSAGKVATYIHPKEST